MAIFLGTIHGPDLGVEIASDKADDLFAQLLNLLLTLQPDTELVLPRPQPDLRLHRAKILRGRDSGGDDQEHQER